MFQGIKEITECPICNENYETQEKEDFLDCKHFICTDCLTKLLSFNCPICRKTLSGKNVTDDIRVKINNNTEINRQKEERAIKLEDEAFALEMDAEQRPFSERQQALYFSEILRKQAQDIREDNETDFDWRRYFEEFNE